MTRKLVQVLVVASGLTFSAYVLTGGTVQQQVNDATAAGISPPNRDATCPIRLDGDYAADAGLGVYQRLTFPVSLVVLPDGGRDVTLPPVPLQKVRAALDVVNWNDCSLDPSTAPVAALWGNPRPFAQAAVKPWCRQRTDLGLSCALIGGASFGDRNITLCTARANPATCERVSTGVVYLGDSAEEL